MRFNKLRNQDETLFLEESTFDLDYLDEAEDAEMTDEEKIDSVDETEESMSYVYSEFMLESAHAIASLYEVDVLCAEAYSNTDSVYEQHEIEVLFENKFTDFIKRIGTKLKNAILAVINWIKQVAIKIYNSIKGKIKHIAAKKGALKDSKYDNLNISHVVVFKRNTDAKSAILSSALYKHALEIDKQINAVSKADDLTKVNTNVPDIDVTAMRREFLRGWIEVRKNVKYKDIRDQVISVAGRGAEIVKANTASVNALLESQIKRIDAHIKSLSEDKSDKATKISALLTKQNTILQACSTVGINATKNVVLSLVAVAARITGAGKADDKTGNKTDAKPEEKPASESLLIDLEAKLAEL